MRINRQTACGIPSAVTDVNVTKTITSLRFSWNAPQHFNGDISQELYQVRGCYLCFYIQVIVIECFYYIEKDLLIHTNNSIFNFRWLWIALK